MSTVAFDSALFEVTTPFLLNSEKVTLNFSGSVLVLPSDKKPYTLTFKSCGAVPKAT